MILVDRLVITRYPLRSQVSSMFLNPLRNRNNLHGKKREKNEKINCDNDVV